MGKKEGPTHVVTSLTRGFRLVPSHIVPCSKLRNYGIVTRFKTDRP